MSKLIAVLGAQWGDEGKGKVVDHLAEDFPTTVRFNGGANAGHTIEVEDRKTVLHLLPSSCTRPGAHVLIGPGVVCDPEVLEEEIDIANACGSEVGLDRGAAVVLPIHKQIDALREQAAGASAIGTTRRGIGPCYEDLISRRGPKLGDMTSDARFRHALTERGWYDERSALVRHLGGTSLPADEVVGWAARFRETIAPRLVDVREHIAEVRAAGGGVILEGAQGVLLDVLHGSWPDCTSSYCTAGGAAATLGVYGFDATIGVAKAYCTRVGSGPFPTELYDATGERLRSVGNEYGATTGRPRRCGWLDLAALRYACRVGGITELCLTKLDILTGMPGINVCRDYRFEGRILGPYETLTNRVLRESEPVYETCPGWNDDLRRVRKIADLPAGPRAYLAMIERHAGVPITSVGVGPGRDHLAV